MTTVNIHDAKTRLSQLVMAAEQGEEIVIARHGVPVVRLVPCQATLRPEPGVWRKEPGWENYTYDPKVLAPLETDEELAGEGWPV